MLTTAAAQVLLKKASFYDARTFPWMVFIGLSAVAYVFSFVLYARILKFYPLNKIYPALTLGQIVLVTLVGVWMGESIGGRHVVGLVCGLFAIYLILG